MAQHSSYSSFSMPEPTLDSSSSVPGIPVPSAPPHAEKDQNITMPVALPYDNPSALSASNMHLSPLMPYDHPNPVHSGSILGVRDLTFTHSRGSVSTHGSPIDGRPSSSLPSRNPSPYLASTIPSGQESVTDVNIECDEDASYGCPSDCHSSQLGSGLRARGELIRPQAGRPLKPSKGKANKPKRTHDHPPNSGQHSRPKAPTSHPPKKRMGCIIM